jgi:hypothetical protein
MLEKMRQSEPPRSFVPCSHVNPQFDGYLSLGIVGSEDDVEPVLELVPGPLNGNWRGLRCRRFGYRPTSG